MSCYVDLVVDIPKLSQFDNIKKNPDLANAILAHRVDFGCQKNVVQLQFDGRIYYFRINKTKRAKRVVILKI